MRRGEAGWDKAMRDRARLGGMGLGEVGWDDARRDGARRGGMGRGETRWDKARQAPTRSVSPPPPPQPLPPFLTHRKSHHTCVGIADS
ncbi:hypothetical protein E2C01_015756 [Portunus trituberculatus]|uniref:Uncharacterized protein n=1 Tax=Portunus trituberculatus TaxID=210409 RepID=A0A5B7DNH0_PORTR|nr:hypothetical protein [Portunus trituberculatus]